jgi:hypothetical protein
VSGEFHGISLVRLDGTVCAIPYVNIGEHALLAIRWINCGDSRDNSPTVRVTAYATTKITVAAAEMIPRLRAVAVNFTLSPICD